MVRPWRDPGKRSELRVWNASIELTGKGVFFGQLQNRMAAKRGITELSADPRQTTFSGQSGLKPLVRPAFLYLSGDPRLASVGTFSKGPRQAVAAHWRDFGSADDGR
jgi:hypothetical protein